MYELALDFLGQDQRHCSSEGLRPVSTRLAAPDEDSIAGAEPLNSISKFDLQFAPKDVSHVTRVAPVMLNIGRDLEHTQLLAIAYRGLESKPRRADLPFEMFKINPSIIHD